jgi:hypothetical protein
MESQKDWIKRHADTMVIIAAVVGAAMWMSNKFNDIDRRLIRIETVLIMKGVMPPELAANEKVKD